MPSASSRSSFLSPVAGVTVPMVAAACDTTSAGMDGCGASLDVDMPALQRARLGHCHGRENPAPVPTAATVEKPLRGVQVNLRRNLSLRPWPADSRCGQKCGVTG